MQEPEEAPATAGEADLLVFPDDLRVADGSVNDFLVKAMDICASGAYDDFRLLWTTLEDPLPRNEFEQGWKAVREIRVRALERIILDEGPSGKSAESDTAYAVLAEVRFDPGHRAGREEPQREIVLMVVRENDVWRLAKAPKAVRQWIRGTVEQNPATPDNPPLSEPASREPG